MKNFYRRIVHFWKTVLIFWRLERQDKLPDLEHLEAENFPNTSLPKDQSDMEKLKVPVHLGVIMDGNGRWAKAKNQPRSLGHRAGADNLKVLCKNCGELGVKFLTVYAFSTENWNRPEEEVNGLMELFIEYFDRFDPELEAEGIRVRFLGDINHLPPKVKDVCLRAEKGSAHRQKMDLIIAFNYGGRNEITQAVQKIGQKIFDHTIEPADINEALISQHLYLPFIPDPDLIIRTSGEQRISNFMIWQGAYTEFYFTSVLWPDFNKADLFDAIWDYTRRQRKFGGLL